MFIYIYSFLLFFMKKLEACVLTGLPSGSSGGDEDYEEWLAHSTEQGDPERNGCVLGVKETYRRLKKQSVCRNGKSFVVTKKQTSCLCVRDDYLW